MDPLTSLVTALAAGAAAALKPTVEQAVKEHYTALKGLIKGKYARVNVEQLEQDPTSDSRRTVAKADLAKTEAAHDTDVLSAAKALLEAVRRQGPEGAGVVGVDMKDIRAALLTIDDIIATGLGVKVTQADVSGDITIELPGISEAQYQHLTHDLGMTQSLLNTLITILQQERVPVEQRTQALHEMAEAHKSGALLGRQALRLQVRAVELIREGKADRALDELHEGTPILTALLNESPANAMLYVHVLLGYFYETIARAFDAAGDRKRADQYLARADSAFQLAKEAQ